MKIAFTGAQSTGKTTLLNKLREDSNYWKYTFIDEITRSVVDAGVEINEGGTDKTQMLIMQAHLVNSMVPDTVMDRCALDGVVYTRYLYNRGQISTDVMDGAEQVFQSVINEYDYIFYLIPEFDIKDDGVRSIDNDFRNQIVKLFDQYILECEVPVIRITGSLEERIKQIEEKINE
jgi:nicotinamide riboside kinase